MSLSESVWQLLRSVYSCLLTLPVPDMTGISSFPLPVSECGTPGTRVMSYHALSLNCGQVQSVQETRMRHMTPNC